MAVGQQLALDLVTHSHTIVAHAHAAWLWFPDVIVLVDQAIHGAVLVTNWLGLGGIGADGGWWGGLFKETHKYESETRCKHFCWINIKAC